METKSFFWWDVYYGQLMDDDDAKWRSILYGFETVSPENCAKTHARVPDLGACYGFIQSGTVTLVARELGGIVLGPGTFFSTRLGFDMVLTRPARVVIMQRPKFLGLNCIGGPIEPLGRLKYIDTCSDTLLVAPPLKGDPCLNHLHFPTQIDQTEHTHPSTRMGIVANGSGLCLTPGENTPLAPGRIFYIPKDGLHKFQTHDENTMDVIAYHPDSDFGPTNQEHPMVNRTLVDGSKIDNSMGDHAKAEVINSVIE